MISVATKDPKIEPRTLLQVHHSYVVNPDRVSEVRRRERRHRDWELKLEPPVNRVIPVGRSHIASLWAAYGEE